MEHQLCSFRAQYKKALDPWVISLSKSLTLLTRYITFFFFTTHHLLSLSFEEGPWHSFAALYQIVVSHRDIIQRRASRAS